MRRKYRAEAKAIQGATSALEKWTLAGSARLDQMGDVNLCAGMMANADLNPANDAFVATKIREHRQAGNLPQFLRDVADAVEWKLNPDQAFVAAAQVMLSYSQTGDGVTYNSEKMTAFDVVQKLKAGGIRTTATQVRLYAKYLGVKLKAAKHGRRYSK